MTESSIEVNAVVQRLVDHVLAEKLAPGDQLPSVRELAERWKLGRNLVRDGLLYAQVVGLVHVRPRSGVVLCAVDYAPLVTALSQTLALALGQRDPTLVHLWQARAAIEVETASEAARRRLPEDLQRLDAILVTLDDARAKHDRAKYIEADESYHLTIAEIAGNPVMSVILESLLKLLRPYRLPRTPPPEQSASNHAAIYDVIAKGDPVEASKVMSEHCHRYARHLLERGSNPRARPRTNRRGEGVR